MISLHSFCLVKWNEHPHQEQLVLFLKRHSEAIDDASPYLKQLSNPTMPLCLKHIVQEHIIHGLPHEGAVECESGIYTVVHILQAVTFPRVFGLEKSEEIDDKLVINVLTKYLGIVVDH